MIPILALSGMGWDTIWAGSPLMTRFDDSIGQLVKYAGTILNTLIDNPILAMLFSAGIIPIAVRIVRKLKRV